MKRELIFIIALSFILAGCATRQPAAKLKASASGGNPSILDSFSPKLLLLLAEHPDAQETLTNAILRAFSGRDVRLYYFYSTSNNLSPAFHFYRGENAVVIVVRANEPLGMSTLGSSTRH